MGAVMTKSKSLWLMHLHSVVFFTPSLPNYTQVSPKREKAFMKGSVVLALEGGI